MYGREARSALDFTGKLVDRFGPRLCGSGACLDTAEALKERAAESADRSWTEDFTVHPGAFLGFIRLLVACYLVATLLLPLAVWASALIASAGILVLVLGFVFYVGILDPFWPTVRGRNVIAILEPSGRAERTLILSGHHDSARVFRFCVDRPELYVRRISGGMGSSIAVWAVSLALWLLSPPLPVLLGAATLLLAGFPLIAPLWNFAAREGTPGAGDNLVASATALEVLAHFRARRDAGGGLSSTRLLFLSFDAEEAGLRGARAWARAHRAEIAAMPSSCYNMDCLYAVKDLRFLTSDVNGTLPLSRELAGTCSRIAAEAGISAPPEPIAFLNGGTDAAELARRGVAATTLIGLRWSRETRSVAYHTPGDLVSAIEPAAIEAAIGIAIGLAERLDAGTFADAAAEAARS